MLKRIAQFSAWQVAAQAMSSATIFSLAALLPAGPLATFGYALNLSSMLSAFVTLRLEQAVLVTDTKEQAFKLAWASVIAAFALCGISVLFAVAFMMGDNRVALMAGAVAALSVSVVATCQQVLILNGESNKAGRISVVRALLVACLVVGLVAAMDRTRAVGALIGLATGSAVVTISSLLELRATTRSERGASVTYREVIVAYRDIWSAYLGQSVLSGVSLNAPYFILFHSVDHRLVAGYLLADRIARTPIALLSQSVRAHLTHSYAELVREKRWLEGARVMSRWTLGLGICGLTGLAGLGMLLHVSARYYSSDKWLSAAIAVGALTLWAASALSNSPAAAALTAWRKNGYILRAQAIELICRLLIIAALIPLAPSYFYICLFFIHLPGIFYNLALYFRAKRTWEVAYA